MRKYGNISHYLANNSSILSSNSPLRKNYDVAPTIRRNEYQKKSTVGIPASNKNEQNFRRTNTSVVMPYGKPKRDWNQMQEQNSPYTKQGQSEGEKSMKNQRILNQLFRKQERESRYPPRQKQTLTQPEWERQMKNSISKLKQIKQNLQSQIKQMQRILDDTSKSIQNMQKEFENIKFRILDYTSKCLDNAFINYRNKMTRWSKYEEVQKKGLQLIDQISDYTNKQTDTIVKVSAQVVQLNYTASLKQIYNRITHYNSMTQQIKKVKQQCIQSHPTLQQINIRKFQASLHELCVF